MILCLLVAALDVTVDPRVELMSIVFRLAGSPEYNHPSSRSPYAADVEKHFARFFGDDERQCHAVIVMARKLRKERGISFDAVMSLAVHCDEKMRYPYDRPLERLDHRWRMEDVRAFLALVRHFREASKFDAFFAAHRALYDAAVASHREIAEKSADVGWFDGFFGRKAEAKTVVILGLLNGPMNYGVGVRHPDGRETLTPVLGMYRFDDRGVPQPVPRFVPLLVHEIAHSYVNPIVDRHAALLAEPAAPLFRVKAPQMLKQAYSSWKIMMYESIVRAAVLEHLRQHGNAVSQQVLDDYRIGFTWSSDLAQLLRTYEADRERFSTFDDFVPAVAAFFRREAQKLPPAPKLVEFKVDAESGTLTLVFDRPMRDRSWSMLLDGDEPFPEIAGDIRYDKKRQVLTVPVWLKPGTRYSLWLNGETRFGFISERGVPLAPRRIEFDAK